MSDMNISKIDDSFIAEVQGLDVANGASPEQIQKIKTYLSLYPVLNFGSQPLNDEQQTLFGGSFGSLVVNNHEELGGDGKSLLDISTVDADGKPLNELRKKMFAANFLWHTDSSHSNPPVHYTTLSARILPSTPPPTEFADMRDAWDDLPPQRQAELEGMKVVHSLFTSRARTGVNKDDFTEETAAQTHDVIHPLVRINPISGRKSLYLASHASHIVGLPVDEGKEILKELTVFATQPKFVRRYYWQPNDLIMWDNFSLMHRATEYNGSEPRYLRWTGAYAEKSNLE